jgi:acetoin utilization deacetylase AcuC-like enzyme
MTGLFADPACKQHLTGPGHPESPQRFEAVLGALTKDGVAGQLAKIKPRLATEEELCLCHTREYVRNTQREILAGATHLSTGDTEVSHQSWDAARLAVGGALNAVDAVVGEKIANAFCAVRPPGHHATPDCGMGFCVFNNVAVAARYAQRKHGLARALIVDWDVHHGNGTQDVFYDDGSVYFFSTHQWPLYPGTGAAAEKGTGAGIGTTLNCPFATGAGRAEILGAFETMLVPAADAFRPDIVFISAGFDSRIGDPLGGFTLTDADFADLTRITLGIARKHGQGRLVSLLEGGYNLDGLASAALAHVKALSGS